MTNERSTEDLAERRLFRDFALSYAAIAELFGSLARDHADLTRDQRGARLLDISAQLERLRDEAEKTRAGTRTLALEMMSDKPEDLITTVELKPKKET